MFQITSPKININSYYTKYDLLKPLQIINNLYCIRNVCAKIKHNSLQLKYYLKQTISTLNQIISMAEITPVSGDKLSIQAVKSIQATLLYPTMYCAL